MGSTAIYSILIKYFNTPVRQHTEFRRFAMKHKTTLLLIVLLAATLFSAPTALSQSENTSEATFYVH
jgi:hypothetical protein